MVMKEKISIPIYALCFCISFLFLCNSPTLGIRFYLPVFLPTLIIGVIYLFKYKIYFGLEHYVLSILFIIYIIHLNTSLEFLGPQNTSILSETVLMLFFFIFSFYRINIRELKLIINSFVFAGTGFSIYLIFFHFPLGLGHYTIRPMFGPYAFMDPNYLSAFMVMPTIILAKKILFDKISFLYFFLFIINLVSTMLTGSRAATIAIFISVLYLCLKKIKIKNIIILLIFSSIVYVFISLFLQEDLIQRLFVNSYFDTSNSKRVFLWKHSLNYTIEHNLFFGSGLVKISDIFTMASSHSHSSFIDIFATSGLVGFFSFFILLLYIFYHLSNKHLVLFQALFIAFIFVYIIIAGTTSFAFWLMLLLFVFVIKFNIKNPNIDLWRNL